MLKSLRKIRQKLVNRGQVKNYLLYAVGKILLVMIGILLALQVNNWNEKRLNQQKELTTIQALQNELAINQTYHTNLLDGLEKNVKKNGLKLIELTKPQPLKGCFGKCRNKTAFFVIFVEIKQQLCKKYFFY